MLACLYSSAPDSAAALLDCACFFSPLVEQTNAHTVVFDISGLERIFVSPAQIAEAIGNRAGDLALKANIAIASNPDAAIHAARGLNGTTVIEPGEEAARLGSLPVEILEPPPEVLETLHRWGIHTFHDLAALPVVGISERLGAEGVQLQKLARGTADRPLVPVTEPLHFEEVLELESPVASLEPLLFILARLLNQLCGRMEGRGLAANELRLVLMLEDRTKHERTLRLPVAMRDRKAFLKLLQLDLEARPPQAPILKVSLACEPVKPRVAQNGLFTPLCPEPEKLELTLARIKSIVGEENAGTPVLLDTHRPDAFRMERFRPVPYRAATVRERTALQILRRFRPPRPAEVQAPSGSPAYVVARGVRGKTVSIAGPWRTSGDWWTANPWSHDEWDVVLSDGAVYRIYRQCDTGQWFIEGCYD